jgi:hypothetical protein
MTKRSASPYDTLEQAHEERIQRCAELGQIVPINKVKCRQHYEGIMAELNATANDVDA